MKTIKSILGSVLALALGLNYALANTTTATTPEETAENATALTAAPPALPESAPEVKSPTPKFGQGMQIPVDGTSLEAFDQSLATIKTKTTKDEFTTLTNAIDYLMVYYIEAKRDRAKLAAYLNGKTGEEVVALVKW